MGEVKEFERVKLFCGVIYRQEEDYHEARNILKQLYSSSDLESATFPFDLTDYYTEEMGRPLFRRFLSFRELILPSQLSEIKLTTNGLEARLSTGRRRRLNIDPGMLSLANVIIATTKNHFHRVPLQDGIYAHLEYVFRRNKLEPLEWTYPDFRTQSYLDFFLSLHKLYKQNRARK